MKSAVLSGSGEVRLALNRPASAVTMSATGGILCPYSVPTRDTLSGWLTPEASLIRGDKLTIRLWEGDRLIDSSEVNALNGVPQIKIALQQAPSLLQLRTNAPVSQLIDSLEVMSDSLSFRVGLSGDSCSTRFRIDTRFLDRLPHGQDFEILMPAGVFVSLYGDTSRAAKFQMKEFEKGEMGSLIISMDLSAEVSPHIVQIRQGKQQLTVHEFTAAPGAAYRDERELPVGAYSLRIIKDANRNGLWDPGNFLASRQPEEVVVYPSLVEIRAGWDQEITIDVSGAKKALK
jgi:hypothetical protein